MREVDETEFGTLLKGSPISQPVHGNKKLWMFDYDADEWVWMTAI